MKHIIPWMMMAVFASMIIGVLTLPQNTVTPYVIIVNVMGLCTGYLTLRLQIIDEKLNELKK